VSSGFQVAEAAGVSGGMIRNGCHNQTVYNLRHPVGDNPWLSSKRDKPLINGRPIGGDLLGSVVMVARADRDRDYFR
jgi:hypothetical protein